MSRSILLRLVQQYESRSGISADHYHAEPRYHPMAEGKYLLTIAAMFRAGLINEGQLREKHAAALRRLRANADPDENGRRVFGLGFGYKESDAKDRFLITNCVVAHGLLDVHALADGLEDGRDLIEDILDWMTTTLMDAPDTAAACQTPPPPLLPRFSEQNASRVINAIAYWCLVLSLAESSKIRPRPSELDDAIDWATSAFVPGIGWPYAVGNDRVDLLHQCYIINSLAHCARHPIELDALTALLNFVTDDNVLDKFDRLSVDSALERLARAKSSFGRLSGNGATIWSNHPARPWSVGEALVTTAWFSRHGVYCTVWRNLGWKLLNLTGLRRESRMPSEWRNQFRHAMHVAHGLAAMLEAERGKSAGGLAEIRLHSRHDRPVVVSTGGWSGFGVRDPALLTRPDGSPALEDGRYRVYFNGRDRPMSEGGITAVGLAESVDLDSWTVDDGPCLSDGTYSAVGSVLRIDDDQYWMFYSPGTELGFRRATSRDGRNWQFHRDLLLEPGQFDCTRIGLPWVVREGQRWLMLFEGISRRGFQIFGALSEDALSWKPLQGGQPVIQPPSGRWDAGGQANPTLHLMVDGAGEHRWFLLYNGHAEGEPHGWSIGMAEFLSLDPVVIKDGARRILDRAKHGTTGSGRLEGARIVDRTAAGSHRLLFFDLPFADSYRGGVICLAEILIGDNPLWRHA